MAWTKYETENCGAATHGVATLLAEISWTYQRSLNPLLYT